MPNIEKVRKCLDCCKNGTCDTVNTDCLYKGNCDCIEQLCYDALMIIKEQEALLRKAYETLAEMDFDFFCDDLVCDDGWCDEHCKTRETMPECIERWMKKQVAEGGRSNA